MTGGMQVTDVKRTDGGIFTSCHRTTFEMPNHRWGETATQKNMMGKNKIYIFYEIND